MSDVSDLVADVADKAGALLKATALGGTTRELEPLIEPLTHALSDLGAALADTDGDDTYAGWSAGEVDVPDALPTDWS